MNIRIETAKILTESIRGCPYMTAEELAKEFSISKTTVRQRVSEIEKWTEAGRYNEYSVLKDGKIVLINVLVFIDYFKYRRMLSDINARKSVPDFAPEKIMRIMGWQNRIILTDTDEEMKKAQ